MSSSTPTITALEEIYRFYACWASKLDLACHKGCAACCTRNVTMTEAEGRLILKGIRETAQPDRLDRRLQVKGRTGRPDMTTNEWAGNCLEGRDGGGHEPPDQVFDPCPFLDQDYGCSLYRFRPFSCRCFGSRVDCSRTGTAEQPDILMEVNTVTLQIIEHLDQGNRWGNMLDLLPILYRENQSDRKGSGEQLAETIGRNVRRSRPLPGFLVMPEQQAAVQAYLDDLFALRIDTTTLAALLQRRRL